MSDLFLALAIICIGWGIVSIIAIASYLSSHGVKINFLLFRLLALKYIHQYHEITKRETGKTGSWFYSYIVSMNLALVLAIVAMLLK